MTAVGGTSLLCYLLMSRVIRGARRQRASGEDAGSGARYDPGGDGGNFFSWFSSDTSCHPALRGPRAIGAARPAEAAAIAAAVEMAGAAIEAPMSLSKKPR